jgi:hypothetical protein
MHLRRRLRELRGIAVAGADEEEDVTVYVLLHKKDGCELLEDIG